jgi:nitrite reductase/ring-hydroxylating ferredoxin subunit
MVRQAEHSDSAESRLTSLWRPLGLSSQVNRKSPLGRSCDSGDYVLFRDSKGVVRALDDRCAHRRAPLSLGIMTRQGQVRCPYHGWTFDGQTGRCVAIPNLGENESVPGRYEVGHYAVAERLGTVFVWTGAAGEADESLLPPLNFDNRGVSAEGEALLTIPWRSFVDTLLDAPTAVLKAEGVRIIDDHLLGEPRHEGGLYVCERAAEWSRRGGRRKLVPADYPLVFRSSLDSHTGAACLELIDDSNRVLASMIACSVPVTDVVTAVYWRYRANYRRLKRLAPELAGRCQALGLAPVNVIDPRQLLQCQPYVSRYWRGDINIHSLSAAPDGKTS